MDLLLKLKIKHSSGIKDYIEQIKKDPEYYMGEVGYRKYKDLLADFSIHNPIYLELSAVDNSPHADMIAIPLKNNMYYIIGYAHSRLDDGDIITSSEVLEYLKLVRKEFDYSEYDYCDDEVYYYNDYYYDVL